MTTMRTTCRSTSSRARSFGRNRSRRDHSAVYGFSGTCACRPTRCSTASSGVRSARRSSSWRASVARFRARLLRTSTPTGPILSEPRQCASVARASKQGAAGRLQSGWAELREARWDAARAAFEKTLAREETPEAFEGLSWAAWWLDDAEAVFEARERAYRLYRKSGDASECRSHGDMARRRPARFPRCVRQLRAAGCAAPTAYSIRSSPGRSTAGSRFTRATSLTRRATPPRRASAAIVRCGAGAAVQRARPRDARSRARGRRARGAAPKSTQGMRCLDEATATALEGEATIPISERVGVLLSGNRLHGRARLRAGIRVVRPHRRVRRAVRQPVHARLLPGRVRRGPPLARSVARGRRRCSRPRSTTSPAHGPPWAGAPLVGLAELRRRQGRPEEAAALLDQAGSSRGGPALPRTPGARPG